MYFLSSTVCIVSRWFDRSVVRYSDVTRESGLMFRTFAQFLFKLFFPEGQGGMEETFGNSGGGGGGGVIFSSQKWKFRRGGGSYLKFPPWWGYGYFLELHNFGPWVSRGREERRTAQAKQAKEKARGNWGRGGLHSP